MVAEPEDVAQAQARHGSLGFREKGLGFRGLGFSGLGFGV